MMALALPKVSLRPYLPEDAEALAAIFRASIEDLTGDDYNPAQQEAWAATSDDEQAFGERLAKQLTLVAVLEGTPVAFAALENNETIDMVYVHPVLVRQGIGSMLIDALEKLAAARSATHLTVEASDSAREFFLRRGFTTERRNTVSLGNEWFANTTMKKNLTEKKSV